MHDNTVECHLKVYTVSMLFLKYARLLETMSVIIMIIGSCRICAFFFSSTLPVCGTPNHNFFTCVWRTFPLICAKTKNNLSINFERNVMRFFPRPWSITRRVRRLSNVKRRAILFNYFNSFGSLRWITFEYTRSRVFYTFIFCHSTLDSSAIPEQP